jgi:hypothetical protein
MTITRVSVAQGNYEYDISGGSFPTSVQSAAFDQAAGNLLIAGVRWEAGDGASAINLTDLASGGTPMTPLADVTFFGTGVNDKLSLFYCLSAPAQAANQFTASVNAGNSAYLNLKVVQYNTSTGTWSYDASGTNPVTGDYDVSPIVTPSFNTAGPGVIVLMGGERYPADVASSIDFGSDTFIEKSATSVTLCLGERINQSAGQSGTTAQMGYTAGPGAHPYLAMYAASFVVSGGGGVVVPPRLMMLGIG